MRISIIGCGWFGLPLAKQLVLEGYPVAGSKREKASLAQLEAIGVRGYALDLSVETPIEPALLDADILVINIPPGLRRGESDYLVKLNRLVDAIGHRQYKGLFFISTTGVYPDVNQLLTEDDACVHNEASSTLLQAEQLFQVMQNSCIVRFSGLVGPSRHPGRFFGGKKDIAGGNLAVNLVHLDDCVSALTCLIKQVSANKPLSSIYNLCAPIHPTKADFYTKASLHLGLEAPIFLASPDETIQGKQIDGSLICHELGFSYQFTNPTEMLDDC